MDGLAKALFDYALAALSSDFGSIQFTGVKRIDRRALFREDFGRGNIDIHFAQSLRNRVQQPDPVFGLDFDDGTRLGGLIIETDLRDNAFAGVSVIGGASDLLFGDQG